MINLVIRELKALGRKRSDVLNPLTFLFLCIVLFVVAVPPDSRTPALACGLLWVIVLLTNLLSLDGMFRRDFESGVLEQIMCSAQLPFAVIGIRIFAQWLATGFLITLMSPLLSLLLGVSSDLIGLVFLTLLLGTPALSLIGAMGASLTVGFSRGGVLLGLLTLPLSLPVLIFGVSAIGAQVDGFSGIAELYWLGFISMLALTIGPFAAVLGLKISLQMQ